LDSFSALSTALFALVAVLTCALSVAYLAEIRTNHGEFYALVLLSTAGMMLLVSSVDLLTLFLGFELMSIPTYVLAGFDRIRLRSNESAIKYFVMGAFASAILLYGAALVYGATGTTAYAGIRDAVGLASPLGVAGLGLLVVGFAFKIAAFPFHQWAPDVYEGAPSVVTAYMSVAVKAAAFLGLMRLLVMAIGPQAESLVDVFWLMAMLTMIVGNVMAIIQDNVKRMLAYSSIAHAGYLLIGITTGTEAGYTAVVFYLVVYAFMNLGAFGVVVSLAKDGRDFERIEDFAGLARSRPGVAAVMAVFMFSLAGIPGTAGFMAKFNIVVAAVEGNLIWPAIVLVLTSVVSVFYYLRIPMLMYMRDPTAEETHRDIAALETLALGSCVAAILFFGIFPNGESIVLFDRELFFPAPFDWANEAIKQLFGS
jgi:NADH-quinone oxidoreductase subunit N